MHARRRAARAVADNGYCRLAVESGNSRRCIGAAAAVCGLDCVAGVLARCVAVAVADADVAAVHQQVARRTLGRRRIAASWCCGNCCVCRHWQRQTALERLAVSWHLDIAEIGAVESGVAVSALSTALPYIAGMPIAVVAAVAVAGIAAGCSATEALCISIGSKCMSTGPWPSGCSRRPVGDGRQSMPCCELPGISVLVAVPKMDLSHSAALAAGGIVDRMGR